jgi:hypothetical protein
MQQRHRRLVRHPAVAVGRPGAATFEETQNGSHSRDGIKGGNQRQFGGTGVGKTDCYTRFYGSLYKYFSAVHLGSFLPGHFSLQLFAH